MIIYDTNKQFYNFKGEPKDLIVEACYLLHLLMSKLKTDEDKILLIRFAMSVLMEMEEDNAGT